MRKVVAISQKMEKNLSRGETLDCMDHKLVEWIVSMDLYPLIVPNNLVKSKLGSDCGLDVWLSKYKPDAVILSGGNDIGEFRIRDETEYNILGWAESAKLPVLGICRGMQIMGKRAGTDLIKVEGHVARRHSLLAVDLSSILPRDINSFHNFSLKECPNEYDVVAVSADGNNEAIRHKALNWEGWMWHPEREQPFNEIDRKNFLRLIGYGD